MASVCVGCGLFVNGSGLLEVQLRPGGGLDCDPDGADAGLYSTFVQAAPTLSPDDCNALESRGNGLFAPCPEGIAGINNTISPQAGTIPLAMVGPNNTYDFESVLVTITNTSACCTVAGAVSFMSGFTGDLAATSKLSAEMAISTNAAAYVASSPASYELFHNLHATSALSWASNLFDQVYSSFAPLEVKTYKARTRFTLISGSGNVLTGGFFELQWTLVPTSCGC